MCKTDEKDCGHFVPPVAIAPKNRQKNGIEKKIVEFVVENDEGTFMPEDYFWTRTKNLVLIGTVTKGLLSKGTVKICSLCKKNVSITASISRIEISKTSVPEAKEGEKVGICIPGVNAKTLGSIRRSKRSRLA